MWFRVIFGIVALAPFAVLIAAMLAGRAKVNPCCVAPTAIGDAVAAPEPTTTQTAVSDPNRSTQG